jgi:hypothetical protein
VTANSLVLSLTASAAANMIQETRVDASPLITEGWMWREEEEAEAVLLW